MRIAIIGGLGSGKSEALRVAREMGVCTLSADEINSQLLEDEEYIAELEKEFPEAVKDKKVDRAALADIVFYDAEAHQILNDLAHPRILRRIAEEERSPLVVEMPLLVESGATGMFDEIILVRAPIVKRLMRMKKYRKMGFIDSLDRIKWQSKQDTLESIATHIVDNNGSLISFRDNVQKVLRKILYENQGGQNG